MLLALVYLGEHYVVDSLLGIFIALFLGSIKKISYLLLKNIETS